MLQGEDHHAVTSQIAVLHHNISQLEDAEAKLLQQLEELRLNITKLKVEKAILESKIAAIWSLPPEILTYIFELGAKMEEEEVEPEEEEKTKENTSSERRMHTDSDSSSEDDESHARSLHTDGTEGPSSKPPFAVVVSHVCQTFRQIAIHTPSLWTKICLSSVIQTRLNWARMYIERSGSLPLSIEYEDEETDYLLHEKQVAQFLDIITPHISRFKSLEIRLPHFDAIHRIMQRLDKPAPLLETLSLCEGDYESGFDEFEEFDVPELRAPLTLFAGQMPNLKTLILDGVHVSWSTCNFHGLKELVLGYHKRDVRPPYEDLKAIIDASPDLELLGLRGSGPTLSEDTTLVAALPVIEMDKLKSLILSGLSSEYVTPLASLLRAPHLRALSLTNLDTNDYNAFLLRIAGPPILFPTVTELKFASVTCDDLSFNKVLLAYPNLKKLTLYVNHENTSWIQALAPDDSNEEVPCQKLETLKCMRSTLYDLKDMLQKRKERGFLIPNLQMDRDTEGWGNNDILKWIRDNAKVEFVEPSELSMDDDEDDDSAWATSEASDGIHLPWYLGGDGDFDGMTDEDSEEDSEMEVDHDDESEGEDHSDDSM